MSDEVPRSAPLRAMADRLDHNKDSKFGGAFVLIPPDGEPQDMLILDSRGDVAVFWATLQTLVQIQLQTLADADRQGYGGRR